MNSFTPRQITEELDKYIIGQEDAKRKVAIALRNRWRRQHLPAELRDEVAPKNIIMIGPTGVGKTEIARRLAKLADAPFLKVEASKFTEVGYVGRDCESMIRELMEVGINLVKEEMKRDLEGKAKERAEARLLDLLLPPSHRPQSNQYAPQPDRPQFVFRPGDPSAGDEPPARTVATDGADASEARVREVLLAKLRKGELDAREVDVEVRDTGNMPTMQVFSNAGMEEMGLNMQEMFGKLFPQKTKRRRVTVAEARDISRAGGVAGTDRHGRGRGARRATDGGRGDRVPGRDRQDRRAKLGRARPGRVARGRATGHPAHRRGQHHHDEVRARPDGPHPVHRGGGIPHDEGGRPHSRVAGAVPDPGRTEEPGCGTISAGSCASRRTR